MASFSIGTNSFKRCLLLASLLPTLVFAQAWPTKQPIKLVAVFPPGGSVDQVARIIAPVLSQQLGQSVIVENKGEHPASLALRACCQPLQMATPLLWCLTRTVSTKA